MIFAWPLDQAESDSGSLNVKTPRLGLHVWNNGFPKHGLSDHPCTCLGFLLYLDLVAWIANPRAWAMAAECAHGYENTYTFIRKVISCSGRIFLRARALKDLVQHRHELWHLKLNFRLRLDWSAD